MNIQLGSFSIPRSLSYIPYSAALLESIIVNNEQAPKCNFLDPIWKYDDTPNPEADILGLTCYVWSQDHIDQLAEKHKEQYPGHHWNQHPFGLWKEDGHMEIFTDAPDDFTSISGIAHFDNAVHKVSIQVMALSTFINENKIDTIDLLKMDCEGAEYDILFNLPENYFSRIKRMAMETHETQQYTTVEMAAFLMAKGYQVKYVTRPATRTGHVWAWK